MCAQDQIRSSPDSSVDNARKSPPVFLGHLLERNDWDKRVDFSRNFTDQVFKAVLHDRLASAKENPNGGYYRKTYIFETLADPL